MKCKPKTPRNLDELDVAIPNMNTQEAEKRVLSALKDISGIVSVRIIERGALVRDDSKADEEIPKPSGFGWPGPKP